MSEKNPTGPFHGKLANKISSKLHELVHAVYKQHCALQALALPEAAHVPSLDSLLQGCILVAFFKCGCAWPSHSAQLEKREVGEWSGSRRRRPGLGMEVEGLESRVNLFQAQALTCAEPAMNRAHPTKPSPQLPVYL